MVEDTVAALDMLADFKLQVCASSVSQSVEAYI